MEKLNDEFIVIKITTLIPDSCEMTPIMGNDNIAALQKVIEELAGDNRTLVEIERA